jgi:4-hydroxy-tetrahydrodipicolinate synthase
MLRCRVTVSNILGLRFSGTSIVLTGSMVALVTPMDSEGSVDYASLRRLIDFHVEAGTEALIIAGTTGESATLAHEEHVEVIAKACEFVAERIPIIAGTGSNSTAQTLSLSKAVDRLDVAAFLIVTPYYNKPTQEGMYRHFSMIADAVSAPVILYNVPSRTAIDLRPETVNRLGSHGNVAGIKEATGELDRVRTIRDGSGPDFVLLSGDDATCCEFMLAGGDGVISVTANVAPAQMRELCDLARAGRREAAERIDARLQGLHRGLFLESNPIPVKWAVQQMGFIGAGIRMPLTALSDEHHTAVADAMELAGVERKAS